MLLLAMVYHLPLKIAEQKEAPRSQQGAFFLQRDEDRGGPTT